jgi:hypothetical protein
MYPHRIRLRGPWECEPLAWAAQQTALPLPPKCKIIMPCRWGQTPLGEFAGTVRVRRRFGYPGRIDPHETVWLTFAGLDGTAEITLNGQSLGKRDGTEAPFEFEVTQLLRPRNELVVDITDATGHGGLHEEVALEIRCLAWLKDVSVRIAKVDGDHRLKVTGRVVGAFDQPLELYVVLGRSPLLYAVLKPTPDGTHFELESEPLASEQWQGQLDIPVRVELVNASAPWYTLDTVVSGECGVRNLTPDP